MYELTQSNKRLILRWLGDCMEKKEIESFPIVAQEWTNVMLKVTMYTPSMRERGLTQWECTHCPWWVDYPIGVLPRQEEGLYDRFVALKEPPLPMTKLSKTEEAAQSTKKKKRKGDKGRVTTPSKNTSKLVSEQENECVERGDIGGNNQKYKSQSKSLNATPTLSCMPDSSIARGGLSNMPTSTMISPFERRLPQRKDYIYNTIVDALLVDIENIDKFAIESIKKFLKTYSTLHYHHCGKPSKKVARLTFANFPTSLLVDGVQRPHLGTMDIAAMLADEGFLVTLGLGEHFGKVKKYAGRAGMHIHCTWTLVCDEGYRHPITSKEVCDLTIGLFYHENTVIFTYNREAGFEIDPTLLPATRSFLCESHEYGHMACMMMDGCAIRGAAEQSMAFYRWLLTTVTEEKDMVIDVFSGCGGLGIGSANISQYCLCIEGDFFVFNECLSKVTVGPLEDDEQYSDYFTTF